MEGGQGELVGEEIASCYAVGQMSKGDMEWG